MNQQTGNITDYYGQDKFLSCSRLKQYSGKKRYVDESVLKHAFAFGTYVDAMITRDPILHKDFALLSYQDKVKAGKLVRVYRDETITSGWNGLAQQEFYTSLDVSDYGIEGLETVPFKCRLDLHYPAHGIVEDIKTGSYSNVLTTINQLDYDLQAFIYMLITGSKMFIFSFLHKKKLRYDAHVVKVNSKVYQDGKKKFIKYLKNWVKETGGNL